METSAFCAHCIEEKPVKPCRHPLTGRTVMVCAACRKRLWLDLLVSEPSLLSDLPAHHGRSN
jgi:hypothetical protein